MPWEWYNKGNIQYNDHKLPNKWKKNIMPTELDILVFIAVKLLSYHRSALSISAKYVA